MRNCKKIVMRLTVVVLWIIALPTVFAEETTDAVQKDASAITSYIQSLQESQAQDAPGGTDVVKNSGAAINNLEDSLKQQMFKETKELMDLNWGLYATGEDGKISQQDAYVAFINIHKNLYCSPDSGIEGLFNTSACKNNADVIELQHGDLKISSLLTPLMYNTDQKNLASAVIKTLTTPFPDSKLSALLNNGLSKNNDINYVATVMAKQAAVNVARNSLIEIYATRVINQVPGPEKVASIISVMDRESTRRFKNENDWYGSVQKSSQEALLRELVQIEAYKLWQDYYRYRQNERIETLLAVMLSQSVDLSSIMATKMSEAASSSAAMASQAN